MSVMTKALTNDAAPPPAAPEISQVKYAYSLIEDDIATLKLKPGAAVSEKMLAARFNIGRTPVREALQQLAREGLVAILPSRGILVTEINVQRQLRLLEARRYIERGIVTMAARRADDNERAAFADLAVRMEQTRQDNDGQTFLELDNEFNQLLLAAARNEYLASSLRSMQGLARRFWFANYRAAANLAETVRLHADIARAIAEADTEAAQKGLDALLDNVDAFTRATLDSGPAF